MAETTSILARFQALLKRGKAPETAADIQRKIEETAEAWRAAREELDSLRLPGARKLAVLSGDPKRVADYEARLKELTSLTGDLETILQELKSRLSEVQLSALLQQGPKYFQEITEAHGALLEADRHVREGEARLGELAQQIGSLQLQAKQMRRSGELLPLFTDQVRGDLEAINRRLASIGQEITIPSPPAEPEPAPTYLDGKWHWPEGWSTDEIERWKASNQWTFNRGSSSGLRIGSTKAIQEIRKESAA